ncbi:MAG: cobalt ABC transporter permease [Methanomicrobiales archaeon]|nr:cobalt ABC transporter permease [Methanomicrobiales archaeon]
MSRGWAGSHLPDPDLITWYGENGRSFLSLLSPWTRVILLAGVVVLVTVLTSPLLLAVLYLTTLLLIRSAGLPTRQILSWSVIPALAVLSLVLLLVWGEPGTPLLTVPFGSVTLVLTDRGLLLAATLLLRALTSFSATLLFLATTRSTHLAAVISRIFPYPADQILLLAYRFLFVTLAMVRSLQKSLWSRGGACSRAREDRPGSSPTRGLLSFSAPLTGQNGSGRPWRAGVTTGRTGWEPPCPPHAHAMALP